MYKQQTTWSFSKIFIAIVFIAGISVAYTFVSAADETVPIETEGVVGKDLLAILDKIESLRLDTSIFTDKSFLSLRDFSVTLVPETPGRSNPFAPLSSSVAPAKTTATSKAKAR